MAEGGKQLTFPELNDELKRPSDDYIHDVFGYRDGAADTEDPKMLEMHYWIERTRNWVRAHGTPVEITTEALTDRWRDELDTLLPLPLLSVGAQDIYDRYQPIRLGSDTWTIEAHQAFWGEMGQRLESKDPLWDEFSNILDVERNRSNQVHHWAWEREHLLGWTWILFKVSEEPPDWVLEKWGLSNSKTMVSPPRLARPIISPAFRHDGRAGLGRISSSQISLALFTACVVAKSEWDATAKGFPRFAFKVPSGEIVITLTPDVVVRADLSTQIVAMNKIRDELSIDDWELLTILMEQVFAEGRPDASAFITDDAVLDYRQIEPKRKGKYDVGHRPHHRARIDASLNRVAHMHIRTDTLHILEDTGKGKPHTVSVDWNEKVIKIKGDITRRDNDAALGWSYEFGKTFTTFLSRPNNYVGYLLQGTIALDGRKEAAKQLAHYLTIHMRINAKNGRGMERFMGELVDGAKLPYNPARPRRTIDGTEDALREVVKGGSYRFEYGGQMFDATSADLDTWTAVPQNLKGYGLLKAWRQQKVVIRAEPDTEVRYDRYRSHALRPDGG